MVNRKIWKGLPKRVKDPYVKVISILSVSRVPRDTRNPVGNREDHLPSLNTT